MEETKDFQLSAEELEYLQNLTLIDESLRRDIQAVAVPQNRMVIIRLSRTSARLLTDYLTTELATVGFDIDYCPTKEGKILEDLIDRFYVP